MRYIVAFFLTSAFAFSAANAQIDIAAGERTFDLCAGCHGFVGEGNQLVGAPRVAGIESWYIERQMQNFAAGVRGHAEGDANGQRMALMAQAADSERKLDDLVAYIALLPLQNRSEEALGGNIDRGQSAYALCAACHGENGRGNESLGAPGLVQLDEWYVVEQLRVYAEGLRGVHRDDTYGQQMRALSSSFSDSEIQHDLAAYIRSLGR